MKKPNQTSPVKQAAPQASSNKMTDLIGTANQNYECVQEIVSRLENFLERFDSSLLNYAGESSDAAVSKEPGSAYGKLQSILSDEHSELGRIFRALDALEQIS